MDTRIVKLQELRAAKEPIEKRIQKLNEEIQTIKENELFPLEMQLSLLEMEIIHDFGLEELLIKWSKLDK